MNSILSKYIGKLFFKKWIIGICRDNIKDIIRSKTFDPDIKWFSNTSFDKFYADPFLINIIDGNYKILLEDYTLNDHYGKISLITLDKSLTEVNHKILFKNDGGDRWIRTTVCYSVASCSLWPLGHVSAIMSQ